MFLTWEVKTLSDDVFGAYADYYDLIYADKDYAAEAEKAISILAGQSITDGELLEIGCGTARHALALAARGFRVAAIDLSEDMLKHAQTRIEPFPNLSQNIELAQGNARNFRLHRKVDAVISLFHVMSYQTTDQALSEAAQTAAAHLEPGGVFLFDMWYGPAVLKTLPDLRVKRVADENLSVVRIAEPDIRQDEQIVEVGYQVFAKRPSESTWAMFTESHTMRYLFDDDLRRHLPDAGFNVVGIYDWDTGKLANDESWSAYCVAVRT